jgi:hypothetical protein
MPVKSSTSHCFLKDYKKILSFKYQRGGLTAGKRSKLISSSYGGQFYCHPIRVKVAVG